MRYRALQSNQSNNQHRLPRQDKCASRNQASLPGIDCPGAYILLFQRATLLHLADPFPQ